MLTTLCFSTTSGTAIIIVAHIILTIVAQILCYHWATVHLPVPFGTIGPCQKLDIIIYSAYFEMNAYNICCAI